MTSRYAPNEPVCPVELELLGLLLRSSEARVMEIVDGQTPERRAALAAFCFQRSHMRDMAIVIASRCNERALRLADALVGEMLIEQVQERPATRALSKPRITLARVA